jgi:glycine betaine catabolism A
MNAFYHTTETFKEGSFTLPGKYYISKEIYQSEMERIFYDRWLCVGRELHIPEPGDYFLSEIGQENIIIVRDKEQKIHAFFNICRHRGTRLCVKERGHLKATIQCPYHAWTYNLQGNLIGAPLMDEVPGFNGRSIHYMKSRLLFGKDLFLLTCHLIQTPSNRLSTS